MKNVVKMTGVAAVLGGVIVLAGCQSSKVMDNRPYVPAASGDEIPAAQAAQPAAAAEVKDLPVDSAPAAQAAPAAQQTYPRFDEADYAPVKPAAKTAAKAAGGTYVVKKGDTVSKIAYDHGVRTADVMAANNLDEQKAKHLHVGQKLVIPEGGKAVKSTKSAKNAKTTKKAATATAAAGTAAAGTAAAADGSVYVVKKGDTIPKIARKLKVKSADLMAANNLDEAATRRLQVGQKLAIPGKGAAPAAETKAAAAPAETSAPTAQTAAPAEAPTEAATPAPQTAPAAETGPATEAAPVKDTVDDSAIPTSKIDTVREEITVRDYLKAKNIKLDQFRKLNGNAFSAFRMNGNDILDAVIPPDTALFIPDTAATPAP